MRRRRCWKTFGGPGPFSRRGPTDLAGAGALGINASLRAGVRSIERGSLIDEAGIALIKGKGASLVAEGYNGDYISQVETRDGGPAEILRTNEETAETRRAGLRKAVAAEVRIG